MLIKYEAQILNFLHSAIPEIKKLRYSEDDSELVAQSKNIEYPSAFYSRVEPDWTTSWHGFLFDTYEEGSGSVRRHDLIPIKLEYKATIICDTQVAASEIFKKLRFYWTRHSYVHVKFPTEEDDIKVGVKLLYIKVRSESNETAGTGPIRKVEFGWTSQLVIESSEAVKVVKGFEIRLFNNNQEIVEIS